MVTIQDGDQHFNNDAAAVATTTVTVNPDQDDDDAQLISFLCRALYDYDAQDASALSFRQGDIIEVLSQQPSGWWDGLLGEERGWFPSNYVTIITDEEVDQALSGSELSGAESSTAGPRTEDPTVDMTHALMSGSQSENEEWLDRELQAQRRPATTTAPATSTGDASRSRSNTGQSAAAVPKAQPGDFWVPEVTPDHQIWFVNERTGERARDIPRESEDEASDGDLAGFTSQSSSRSTTSVNMPFTLNGATDPANSARSRSNTDTVQTSRTTPEPWVKKLWNDGTSYYYYNTVDGTSQWTRPHARNGSSSNPNGANLFVEPASRPGDGRRLSVYSDSSDIQPLDYIPNGQVRRGKARERPPTASVDPAILELTSAEKIAKSLQQALEPSPPEVVADLTSLARSAIQAVVDNVQAGNPLRKADEFAYLDDLVSHVVVAVRNLLYVVAIPTGHIPSSVLPRGERDHRSQSSQSSPLRGAQRKVTATLSRLVLSARAMQYDSGSQLADTLNRIESDAEELERAILFFVSEVQRIQPASDPNSPELKAKRLQGVLSNSNIGLGLVGAGAAATWKGLGWVSLENDAASPKKTLDATVVSDIGGHLSQLQDTIAGLSHALRIVNDSSVEQVRQRVQQTVTQVSAFLTLTSDINIARHVDIDGIRQGEVVANDQYSQSVDNARRLVRTLETVLQALYDDTAALHLTTQNIRDSNDGSQVPGDRESSYDLLDKLSTALSSNLSQCRQAIEAILSVGREQAELAAGDYRGSIEWRMSRLSVIHAQFGNGGIAGAGNGANHTAKADDAYDSENEGVVDLGFALDRPGGRKKSVTQDSSYESGRTFANGVGASTSSLNPTDTDDMDSTLVSQDLQDDGDFFDDLEPKPPVRSKKDKNLEKWLGTEYADKVAADSRPWYLRPNYEASEIIIEADGSVRGGTVTALVERLTAHEHLADRTYTEAFLMTFKSFTTVEELTELLIERFRIQPPEGLTPAELDEWSKLKQKVIQIRVMNAFKSIVTSDDILEKEDMYVLDKIDAFVSSEHASAFPAAKQIKKLIEQRIIDGSNLKSLINTTLAPPPPPIVPKNIKKLRLTDIEPLELARQLTIMESQLYQRIKPMECLQRAREQKTENMDNIAVVIQTSNKIADWVADLVLSKEDSKRRAAIVKHLISVADRCRTLNNFSSMIAITSGLNTPIRRLKRTWEQVGQRYMAQFGACEMTIDSNKNFTKYRQLMASVTPPCVPFIGVFLSTLQFIQDGNPDNLPGGLVNFRKRQKASEVISDIKRWQTQSFNLQQLPVVFNFIEESLNQFSDTKASSDIFWQLSLEREPREREDEKMARLLQESGFL